MFCHFAPSESRQKQGQLADKTGLSHSAIHHRKHGAQTRRQTSEHGNAQEGIPAVAAGRRADTDRRYTRTLLTYFFASNEALRRLRWQLGPMAKGYRRRGYPTIGQVPGTFKNNRTASCTATAHVRVDSTLNLNPGKEEHKKRLKQSNSEP